MNSSSENSICRICLSQRNLITTSCDCSGSVGFIHEDCLKTWTKIRGNICEICHQKIHMKDDIPNYIA